jgi:predicted ferric reductase
MLILLSSSLDDLSAHLWWYLGRSSGFVAFWLLFASVALGLAVSSRIFDGVLARAWVFELHKFLSIFVLVAMTFHGLIMLPDPYAKFSLSDLLVPFASHYRTNSMAIGIITLYGSALISATFYIKGLIGQKTWRLIHYATFALFYAALAHGTFIGTDTERLPAQYSYLAAGTLVIFLTFFRILAARSIARPKVAPKPAAAHKLPEAA